MVSDSDQLRGQIVEYLEATGIGTVHEVASAEEARRELGLDDRRRPQRDWDLMVVDLKSNDRPMIELCRECDSNLATQDLSILAITRKSDPRTVQTIISSGCTDFLETPVSEVVLQHRARNVLEIKGQTAHRDTDEPDAPDVTAEPSESDEGPDRSSTLETLTQIPDPDDLQDTLEQEWTRHQRSGSPLSILLVDVDDLDAYNDRYGREEGDSVLLRIGNTLNQCLKHPGDFLARSSDADFTVLLPETDMAGARTVAEDMLSSVREQAIEHYDSPRDRLSVSLGVCSMTPDDDEKMQKLTVMAERALQDAKSTGGDGLVAILTAS